MTDLLERQPKKNQTLKSGAPKYVALADLLRAQILRQEYSVGDRLPSFSELRAQYGATPTTAERVYGLLEQEGLVERLQGSGTFVTQPERTLTGNIGFIGGAVVDSHQSPFKARLMKGVQQVVEAKHQHLLHMGTDYSLNVSACKKVDGVLIANIKDIESVLQRLPEQLPRVSLLNIAEGITSVVADDYEGAKMAMRHLLDLGHRRIACLMEKMPSLARRRYAGYSDALLEAGIEADAHWARLATAEAKPMGTEQPYLEWARVQMRSWLREGWKEFGCTAIVVQNEVAAIGVMQILQEEGIQVPQQVSVIGFDGTEVCDLVIPRLTAVELPLAQIGAQAVEMLMSQIQGGKPVAQVIALPTSLRLGDSVAPPSPSTF